MTYLQSKYKSFIFAPTWNALLFQTGANNPMLLKQQMTTTVLLSGYNFIAEEYYYLEKIIAKNP